MPDLPNPIISQINQEATRRDYDAWAESRPHWSESCFEAYCAGILDGKSPNPNSPARLLEAVIKWHNREYNEGDLHSVVDKYLHCQEGPTGGK